MHIENMEKSIESLATMLSAEVAKGADGCLEEMSEVADIIKDLSESKYYCTITKEMKEAKEEEETLVKNGVIPDGTRYYRDYRMMPDMYGNRYYGGGHYYNDYRMDGNTRYYSNGMNNGSGNSSSGSYSSGGRYYNDSRYADGRFTPSDSGSRRSYTVNYPTVYDPVNEFSQNQWRLDSRPVESKYDRAKRYYTQSKKTHTGNETEDMSKDIESLESFLKAFSEDIADMIDDASPDEKNVLRNRLTTLVSRI